MNPEAQNPEQGKLENSPEPDQLQLDALPDKPRADRFPKKDLSAFEKAMQDVAMYPQSDPRSNKQESGISELDDKLDQVLVEMRCIKAEFPTFSPRAGGSGPVSPAAGDYMTQSELFKHMEEKEMLQSQLDRIAQESSEKEASVKAMEQQLKALQTQAERNQGQTNQDSKAAGGIGVPSKPDVVDPASIAVGDRIEALPGREWSDRGVDYYKGGDTGIVQDFFLDNKGREKFHILWEQSQQRTQIGKATYTAYFKLVGKAHDNENDNGKADAPLVNQANSRFSQGDNTKDAISCYGRMA